MQITMTVTFDADPETVQATTLMDLDNPEHRDLLCDNMVRGVEASYAAMSGVIDTGIGFVSATCEMEAPELCEEPEGVSSFIGVLDNAIADMVEFLDERGVDTSDIVGRNADGTLNYEPTEQNMRSESYVGGTGLPGLSGLLSDPILADLGLGDQSGLMSGGPNKNDFVDSFMSLLLGLDRIGDEEDITFPGFSV